ncbi:NO-inducible flavohemoprotein [Cytobacillus purgationiresistens]|uniref:Flavohemoprotein n=1 Tax=Cytobacillus purgationiresistens TaxID=863449 RepID=A0ABU0AGS5_9BACI|nr:NO-inducible flavohemoprotein [Cytobacillus purgationiresistens]MDQ0270461.1 nitric oxide dioxygenase [Cytobacillus purgationiresistens]
MLSQQTIDIIKSTVPVLEAKGTDITKHFYKRLFDHHPELLNIFNHANQAQGRQQTALANTLYAAAQYVDQLEVLVPAVTQISHKHRSLGVKKEHYPIVGHHLLASMEEVLGDSATEEIIGAWGEAYHVISQIFIDVEDGMYQHSEGQPGGWKGFKPFTIVRKVEESALITSFYLKPKEGMKLPAFSSGQYVTIQVKPEEDKYTSNRQYSLSDASGKDYLRISVKKEDKGKVSNYLHNHANIGDEISLSAPAGNFVLNTDSASPVVLLSGGVGITPLMSMFNDMAENNHTREVTFVHACKNEQVHAFKKDAIASIEAMPNATLKVKYEETEGLLTKEDLEGIITKDADFYICGPMLFMKAVISGLVELGVEEEKIHFEFFGPALSFDQVNELTSV